MIPNNKTKGAEAAKPPLTTCEQTPDRTAVGGKAKLSTRASRATHVPSVVSVDSQHSTCSSLVTPQVEGTHTTGFAYSFLLPLGGDYPDPDTQKFEQAAAGGGESWTALGLESQEEGKEEAEQEKGQEEKMNPKSFPNTRGALSAEEPKAVNMSLDSPDSPEEAGANTRSPSPTPDYNPEEEADMLLDQAEAIEAKVDSPEYIAPGSRSPSIGRTPSPISALFHQVCRAGADPETTADNLERSRKSREEEGRSLGKYPGQVSSWIRTGAALSRQEGASASKTHWPRGEGREQLARNGFVFSSCANFTQEGSATLALTTGPGG